MRLCRGDLVWRGERELFIGGFVEGGCISGSVCGSLSASAIVSSEAQTITTWSSSSLSGTFNWSTGLTGLSEGGEMSCTQQSLYYGIGGGTVYPLPTANSASITVSGHGTMSEHTLTTYYSIPDIGTLSWAIGLDGNTWGETMQFWNNSGSSANLSLFQYSYFVLGSAPGSQTLGITQPFQDEANFTQSGGGYYLTLNAQAATGPLKSKPIIVELRSVHSTGLAPPLTMPP